MRQTLSPALVAWTIAALAAVSLAMAQTYDAATRTVTVAPSGGDDTLALRAAFDVCQAVGPGCTVQLTAGVFRTRQIEVWGFDGTFAGAGMDATVVETLAPLPILDITQRFAGEQGPVLLTFRDPSMRLRDMTVRNGASVPTTGWPLGPRYHTAIWTLVVLEGTSVWVDAERIAIEAVPDDVGGHSVWNGVWISGLEVEPGGPIAPMTASVTFRDSRIHGVDAGLLLWNVEATTLLVRDSVIDAGMEAVVVNSVGTSLVEVRGSELTGSGPGVMLMLHQARYRAPLGPTTLVLADNVVRARLEDPRARAFLLVDEGRTASQFAVVVRNAFEVSGGAAVGGAGGGLVVRDNRVTGRAEHGILVGGGPPGALASGWVVVGNDLSELVTSREPIAILPVARGAIVVCDAPAEVYDAGRDSLVACD